MSIKTFSNKRIKLLFVAILLLGGLLLVNGCGRSDDRNGTANQASMPAANSGQAAQPKPAVEEPTALNDKAEAPTDASFRFVVLGDSRAGDTSQEAVNEKVLRGLLKQIKDLPKQPSFLLFTGDAVRGGSDVEGQLTTFKQIVEDYYPMTTFFPAQGNHENSVATFSKVFSHLKPADDRLSKMQKTVYDFDFGNSRFIVLNSNSNGRSEAIDKDQRSWLENLLANNDKAHTFVMFHHPAYPVGNQYGKSLDKNPVERDTVWNVLQKYNVDAVFVGHEHNYNRREVDKTFNAGGFTFDHPIYQITTGGGGGGFNQKDPILDSRNLIGGIQHKFHYVIVDVKDDTAKMTVVDNNNKMIDAFSVKRSKPSK